MARKPLLWILSWSLVLVLILSGAPKTSHAQDTTSDFPISITITGVIQSISADQITLTNDTVVLINDDTSGLDELKVGSSVVITAELSDDDLVAVSISLDDGTTADDPTLGSADDPVDDSDTVGKGNKDNKNKNDDCDEDDDEDNQGNGKGNGKGNKNKNNDCDEDDDNGNGKGNGKDNSNKNKNDKDDKDKEDKDDKGESEAQCLARTDHPVATRLAEALDVSYNEIQRWHCAGNGFGEIARAYMIARETGKSVADIFAMREDGMGWGKILKELGLHPSDFAPGKLKNKGKGKGND